MRRILSWIAALALVLGACQSGNPGGGNGSATGEASVGVGVELTALLNQVSGSAPMSTNRLAPLFVASDVMTGSLQVTGTSHTGDSVSETFSWSIYLEASTLAVQSNRTVVLPPGSYDFAMLVTRGDQSYAGQALGVAIADGSNTVPITIRPVIGEATTNVQVVARLVDFRFAYDPTELSLAGFTSPQMGIRVNDGIENIFAINPLSGQSGNMFLNLVPGPYNFRLALYDGAMQRGKSVPAQEDVVVTPGVNLRMDLVALHGEVQVALTESGGDATFSFNVPTEVVFEAGGLANLHTEFTLSSPRNGVYERPLTLAPAGTQYTASTLITPFQFDSVSIQVAFTDISRGELLGSCLVESVNINTTGSTSPCSLTLRRRSIISGSLLATLGVNVYNVSQEPSAGARVYANGVFKGLTGSGAFGTPGYLKVYLTAGSYNVTAVQTGAWGLSSVTLQPLGIGNVVVSLDQALALSGVTPIAFSPEARASTLEPTVSRCDDCTSGLIPLGFDFWFFGNRFNQVNISSNGFIGFSASMQQGCCNGRPLPSNDGINNIIAAAWTDLYPPGTTIAEIRHETRGTAPNRRFIVDYILVPEFASSVPRVTTQIILYEADSSIEIHTTEMDPLSSHVYTQGVENADGTIAFFLPGRVAANFSLFRDAVRFGTN